MLKNPSRSYQDRYSSTFHFLQMTNEEAEDFIYTLFNASEESVCGTAPADKWWKFLNQCNKHDSRFILSEAQMRELRPYCLMNKELEMAPDEFINLLKLVKDKRPYRYPSKLTSSSTTSHSSRGGGGSSSSGRRTSYFNDRASINHPDSITSPSAYERRLRNSGYNDGEQQPEDYNMYSYNRVRRERDSLKRQLQQYDAKNVHLSKQHSDRMNQLRTTMDQQRVTISELNSKERELLDTISKLKNSNHALDSKHAIVLKKLQKTDTENEHLLEQVLQLEESLREMTSDFEAVKSELEYTKSILDIYKNDKEELNLKADQDKKFIKEIKQDAEAQRQENAKLMELIDRQKFDLDEARSGLQHHERAAPNDQQELKRKIVTVQKERDEHVTKLSSAQEELTKAKELQDIYHKKYLNISLKHNEQNKVCQKLSLQLDEQHKVVEYIQAELLAIQQSSVLAKTFMLLSFIPWSFLLYHIILILVFYLTPNPHGLLPHQNQPFFLSYLDEWFYKQSYY